MNHYLKTTYVFLFAVLVLAQAVRSQSNEQMKSTAESALQRMSPDEIDRKIKELGLTREEAARKASELNISLEDYLTRKVQPSTTTGAVPTSETGVMELSRVPTPSRVEVALLKRKIEIPGFKQRKGVEDLLPFGYEIFQNPPSTFEPTLNVATPESYQLGPGDEVIITVWGETKLYYQLAVNREGNVLLPDIGPVGAYGYTIQQFREKLFQRMSLSYSGLKGGTAGANAFLDVSLGKLRTIQVFVLGEVQKPGGYVLSSMSTTLHALYLAGGPSVNGSMRNVQVNRAGKSSITFDLYDYIIKGSKANDTRLQNGDIVFVPPAGKRAAIAGNVVRQAIYELKSGETLSDLTELAGGFQFNAYFERVHIERVIPFNQRKQLKKDLRDIDLKFKTIDDLEKSSEAMEDGDIVTVLQINNLPQNRVTIVGNVKKPGVFELRPGMRIRDLILAADSLDRNTFAERGNLFHLLSNLRRELIPFSPRLALAGDEKNNLLLRNEDAVTIYKESQFFPEHTVMIAGAVRNPGKYPRNENMSVADLVVLAGGIKEDATTKGWEISRIDSSDLSTYSRVYKIDMPEEYWNDRGIAKFLLEDFDFVFVPANPRYSSQKFVQVGGYVLYPGLYSITNEGERLADIIKRAGGLRPGAYLEGSKFVRKSIDVTWNPTEGTEAAVASATLFDSLKLKKKTNEPASAGWIPLDFKKALDDPSSRDNIAIEEGDSIYVAYLEDLVYVKGEVFVPSPAVYKRGEGVDYYIKQAGGFKEEADGSKVVVFLPGGKKWESGWFILPNPEILPGSLIYVPKKIEKEDKTLPILTAWATVMASLAAITVAIVQVTK
jgi:protein involved in polysaccharide export with SLBB domain